MVWRSERQQLFPTTSLSMLRVSSLVLLPLSVTVPVLLSDPDRRLPPSTRHFFLSSVDPFAVVTEGHIQSQLHHLLSHPSSFPMPGANLHRSYYPESSHFAAALCLVWVQMTLSARIRLWIDW